MEESYIRFRETNNWEMERWRFYIPLRGNERAIRILADALRRLKPVNRCFVGEHHRIHLDKEILVEGISAHVPYDIRLMPMPGDRVDTGPQAASGPGCAARPYPSGGTCCRLASAARVRSGG